MVKVLKLLLFIQISLLSYAVTAGTSVDNVTLKMITGGWGEEGFYLVINESKPLVEGCTDPRFFLGRIDPLDNTKPNPLLNQNLSMALAALTTQSPVNLYVVGCYADTQEISAISIIKK